jgi:hypothetical protein
MKQEDLKREVRENYQKRGHADPEAATSRFIEDVRDYAGLLLERGHREYGFIHLNFQEFLAAVGIAQTGQESIAPIVEVLGENIGDANWHEVIQLAIGYIGIIQQRDEAAGAVLQKILDQAPGAPGQAAVLAGEALIDVGAAGVTPQCFRSITEALSGVMLDYSRIKPVRRAAAGRIIGKLGEDRRLGVGLKNGLPDIDWVPVEADPFTMGSDEKSDSDALDDELPQFECTLIESPFRISRYPVTVAQFQAFIEADGYKHKQYWTPVGWKWRDSENIAAPEFFGELFQTPNHPQVGVSWYEAAAYCDWLSLKTGETISLPTEAQWEKAGRSTDGRVYPWGDRFDPVRCNSADADIYATSAVGIFPNGKADCGAVDLSGNVFEWCRSIWLNNYENYQQKVDDSLDGKELRVLRGGSFHFGR